MPVDKYSAKIGLPFGVGEIGGEWAPDNAERDAAWEMYVELITRIGVADLGPDEGLVRETLSSWYSLFATTRQILRDHGPVIARPAPGSSVSFGHLAVAILNGALRPFLARWHPLLDEYEQGRPQDVSRLEWERAWTRHGEIRSDVAEVGRSLTAYAGLLGDVCDAKDLLKLSNRSQGGTGLTDP